MSSPERAIGLKCNDCGRHYEWNRNISKRKKCEECGCQWLELWGVVVPDEEFSKWPKGKQRWSNHNPIGVSLP